MPYPLQYVLLLTNKPTFKGALIISPCQETWHTNSLYASRHMTFWWIAGRWWFSQCLLMLCYQFSLFDYDCCIVSKDQASDFKAASPALTLSRLLLTSEQPFASYLVIWAQTYWCDSYQYFSSNFSVRECGTCWYGEYRGHGTCWYGEYRGREILLSQTVISSACKQSKVSFPFGLINEALSASSNL